MFQIYIHSSMGGAYINQIPVYAKCICTQGTPLVNNNKPHDGDHRLWDLLDNDKQILSG